MKAKLVKESLSEDNRFDAYINHYDEHRAYEELIKKHDYWGIEDYGDEIEWNLKYFGVEGNNQIHHYQFKLNTASNELSYSGVNNFGKELESSQYTLPINSPNDLDKALDEFDNNNLINFSKVKFRRYKR